MKLSTILIKTVVLILGATTLTTLSGCALQRAYDARKASCLNAPVLYSDLTVAPAKYHYQLNSQSCTEFYQHGASS